MRYARYLYESILWQFGYADGHAGWFVLAKKICIYFIHLFEICHRVQVDIDARNFQEVRACRPEHHFKIFQNTPRLFLYPAGYQFPRLRIERYLSRTKHEAPRDHCL